MQLCLTVALLVVTRPILGVCDINPLFVTTRTARRRGNPFLARRNMLRQIRERALAQRAFEASGIADPRLAVAAEAAVATDTRPKGLHVAVVGQPAPLGQKPALALVSNPGARLGECCLAALEKVEGVTGGAGKPAPPGDEDSSEDQGGFLSYFWGMAPTPHPGYEPTPDAYCM